MEPWKRSPTFKIHLIEVTANILVRKAFIYCYINDFYLKGKYEYVYCMGKNRLYDGTPNSAK